MVVIGHEGGAGAGASSCGGVLLTGLHLVSYSSSFLFFETGSHYVVRAGMGLTGLPLPLECWNQKCVPCLVTPAFFYYPGPPAQAQQHTQAVTGGSLSLAGQPVEVNQ